MRQIPVPETITIGGFTYEIHLTERDTMELKDSDTWGEHSERQRYIRIQQGIKPQQFSSTFIHELLHGINAVFYGKNISEDGITQITAGLLQVMEQMGIRFVEREVKDVST